MSRTTCLITGCALRLEHSSSYAWGDLLMQGDRFIFNAVLDPDECTTGWRQWDDLNRPSPGSRAAFGFSGQAGLSSMFTPWPTSTGTGWRYQRDPLRVRSE
jgi:hypothetical protein